MTSEKNILRQEALRHRAQINLHDEDPADAVPVFMQAIKPQAGQVISLYHPKDKEFDVLPLHEELEKQGVQCALPVMQPGTRILKFVRWEEGTQLHANKFGIMEPEHDENILSIDPDIVVAPMLAFDRRGTRLGYGGGYYDCTLEDLRGRKDVNAVGIAYSTQAVLFNLPREEHDQYMDWVVTPKNAHFYGDL